MKSLSKPSVIAADAYKIMSMPFYWIAISFAAGIALASIWTQTTSTWFIFLVSSILASLFVVFIPFGKKFTLRWLPALIKPISFTKLPRLILIVFLGLGSFIFQASQYQNLPSAVNSLNDTDQVVLMTGTISEDPDQREKLTLTRMRLESFQSSDGEVHKTKESIMVFLSPSVSVEIGDRLTISGIPVTPMEDEEFSYKKYLASQGIFTLVQYPKVISISPTNSFQLQRILYRVRNRSMQILDRIYPMPESALIQGILLGKDDRLPEDLKLAFTNSGTSHIIAISGFNIAIIVGLAVSLLGSLLGKWKGALAALICIIFYTLLVGASPSVVRAAIMGSLGMAGTLIGRKNTGLNTLSLTAFVMLLFDPWLLWSISFQLSLMATLGLVLFAQKIQSGTETILAKFLPENQVKKSASLLGEYLLFTIATQITTFPILLFHFNRLPLASLIANPLILPAQPFVMVLSLAALILAWISPAIGQLASWLSLPFITYTIKAVTWFGSLNFSIIQSDQIGIWLILFYYAFLTIPAALPGKFRIPNFQWKPLVPIGATFLVACLLVQASLRLPLGAMEITVAGNHAETVLIHTPSDQMILINGFRDRDQLRSFIEKRLPFYSKKLDAVLTVPSPLFPEKDLPDTPAYTAELIYHGSTASQQIEAAQVSPTNSQNVIFHPGDSLLVGEDIQIKLISADEKASVLELSWGSNKVKLAYGAEDNPDLCHVNILISDRAHTECAATQVLITPARDWNAPNHIDIGTVEWVQLSSRDDSLSITSPKNPK